MTSCVRPPAWLGLTAVATAFAMPCAQALAAHAPAGRPASESQPASEYALRPACAQPARGHASCLAVQLAARTPLTRTHPHRFGLAPGGAAAAMSPAAGGACATPTAAEGCFGLTPQDLHSAYQLPGEAPDAQTVALVDAYNDPTAEADLKSYDEALGLPACTAANGCFEQVDQDGESTDLPFPHSEQELEEAREGSAGSERQEEAEEAEGWTIEMSLDIETVRAVCHSCRILLVEAEEASDSDLQTAERTAARLGADEISNSWAGPECVEERGVRECEPDSSAFEQPGIVITVAAGDYGYLDWDSSEGGFADYPATSPHVVAVGGTRLLLTAAGARASETVWNDGGESKGEKDGHGATGGGCSVQFEAQPWQQSLSDWSSVGCGRHRAVADVAADADPYTGLAVYDSSSLECETAYEEEVSGKAVEQVVHWCTIGGTSLASPLIASVFALAGGAHGVEYPARTLYENALDSPGSLFDVTKGSNGECKNPFDEADAESGCSAAEEQQASCPALLICRAGSGYDGPTGVGTPNGIAAFQPPAAGEKPGGSGGSGGQGSGGGGSGGSGGQSSGGGSSGGGSSGGGSSGGESSGGGSSGGGSSGGGSTATPVAGAGAGTPTTGSPSGSAASAAAQVRLSGLALTMSALVALDSSHPRIAKVAFTFVSNASTRVSVSLQKLVRRRGHGRWQPLMRAQQLLALSGRNTRRLSGHGALGAGTYRLTLTPPHGAAAALVFKIG